MERGIWWGRGGRREIEGRRGVVRNKYSTESDRSKETIGSSRSEKRMGDPGGGGGSKGV